MASLDAYRQRIDEKLEAAIPAAAPPRLVEAMRYALLGGGKRVRPCLVYLAAEAAGAPLKTADSTACAIEMIHAYSLVHDDLPAMDDDSLRRGQPTCHIQFDEAMAILVGDALQARAFEIIATDAHLSATQRAGIIAQLAAAAGAVGMVGGQVIDLASEDSEVSVETLIDMHERKTGALIAASASCGAICGNADEALRDAMQQFGRALGLAFQVRDDILDETGDTERLGKTAGADVQRRKSTFISTLGLERSTAELDRLRETARQALAPLGESGIALRELADFIISRDH